ncbi:MAG: hypothetical protein ABSD31_02460 [Candidatus Binataceae bacterium]
MEQIIDSGPYFDRIDGRHIFPTSTSEPPKAADVVSALQQGYQWTTNGKDYVLANPVRIFAYLDYMPWYPPPPLADQQSSNSLPPLWWSEKTFKPVWSKADFSKLPKNYQWKVVTNEKGKQYNALVPDGWTLKPDGRGRFKLVRLKDVVPRNQEPLSYSDEIVRDVWPVPQDYFYVELRNGSDDNATEDVCFTQPDDPKYTDNDYDYNTKNSVICGYFKIGNFLQVLQRLADMARLCKKDSSSAACEQSIFGIGSQVPSWADISTSYTATEKIWVPAHDPDTGAGKRDRQAFFTLYKLYQMTLVNTSTLVTGSTPITISK